MGLKKTTLLSKFVRQTGGQVDVVGYFVSKYVVQHFKYFVDLVKVLKMQYYLSLL